MGAKECLSFLRKSSTGVHVLVHATIQNAHRPATELYSIRYFSCIRCKYEQPVDKSDTTIGVN